MALSDTMVPTITIPPEPGSRTPQRYDSWQVIANLDDLRGPVSGILHLPKVIDRGPLPDYDLTDDAVVRVAYATVLREAPSGAYLAALLNKDRLARLWPSLRIPRRLREAWEMQHPCLVPHGRATVHYDDEVWVRKYMPTFGFVAAAIKGRRYALGLTIQDVAQKAGVSEGLVESLELGVPTSDTGAMFAVLDVVKVFALAIPPLPTPAGSDIHHVDLYAHIGTYLQQQEANRER